MTFREFSKLVKKERARGSVRFLVPVTKRLSADLLTPVSAFLLLRERGSFAFLLESVEGGDKLGRFSFLGKNPYRILEATDDGICVRGARDENAPAGDIFEVLQHYLDAYREVRLPGLPRFTCGAVGFFGYDNVRLIERLPDMPQG